MADSVVQCPGLGKYIKRAETKKGQLISELAPLLAPAARFELATDRLTVDCSTTELRRIKRSHGEEMEARTGVEPVYTALQAAA